MTKKIFILLLLVAPTALYSQEKLPPPKHSTADIGLYVYESIDNTVTIKAIKSEPINGLLYFKDGKFYFEGDADKSAKTFIEQLNKEWLRCKCECPKE